ncbi:MAG: 4-hydroxybenzoate octaprenyltransferase [Lysobacterales bacterium]
MIRLLTDPKKRRAVIQLTRLDKPIGVFLLLWPTLWALWVAADGWPKPRVLVVFLLGTLFMRMAGCAINDFADRKVDGGVARTQNRPLATGALSAREALWVFGLLIVLSFALVLTMNALTIALSFGGAALAAVYPFMKRVTHLPQLVLGAAFSWAIPMAFAAQTGSVPSLAWLMFLAAFLLTIAYDTMYAMVDRADDLEVGIKSIAIALGELDRPAIGLLQALLLLTLLLVGQQCEFGGTYLASIGIAAGLCVYQQWLIRHREPQACFRAFLNNQWLGLAVFVGILVETTLLPSAL